MRRHRSWLAALAALLCVAGPARATTPVGLGDRFVLVWDLNSAVPKNGGEALPGDAAKGYGVFEPGAKPGWGRSDLEVIPPVPADGSVVAGGAVQSVAYAWPSAASAQRVWQSAWTRIGELELLGGSARGGISLRSMLTTAEVDCAQRHPMMRTTFTDLEIAGQRVPVEPAANTVLTFGATKVILNEQHPLAGGATSVIGLHILQPPGAVTGGGIDVRLGDILLASSCGRISGGDELGLRLALTTTSRLPLPQRPMTITATLRNTAPTPCELVDVDMHPGLLGWTVTATAGDLGTAFEPTVRIPGDAHLAPSITLAPGQQVTQRFVVTATRKTTLRVGSVVTGTCLGSGRYTSPLGAFPRG